MLYASSSIITREEKRRKKFGKKYAKRQRLGNMASVEGFFSKEISLVSADIYVFNYNNFKFK